MNEMKYETKILLYDSYFDVNKRLTPKSILNIFQDVASHHSEELGIGFDDLIKLNLYWVLSRIKFDIISMPYINQEVIVQTWPHEKGRIDFDRDIKITSLDGNTLVIGTSKWCVIDTQTRMLQRSTNVNYNGTHLNIVNYPEKFNKISIPDINPIHIYDYKVCFSDLDHNNHMNNTNYATLISNVINNKCIKHFEINFLNECLYNDIINISLIQTETNEIVIGTVNDKKAFVALVY